MNKILVKVYIPLVDEIHDIWIPRNKTVYNIIILLAKNIYGADEFEKLQNIPLLYNRYTGNCYNINLEVKDTDIKNGSELILI